MKFLIAGLGNPGLEYIQTRHNIGFDVADALAKSLGVSFNSGKKASVTEGKFKGRTLFLIKPTTYMNLSGDAIRYWMQDQKIPLENLLIIADELALPFGTLRLRASGGPAGHNGLISIISTLGTEKFARLRFGIGSDFPKGRQADFVLGNWTSEEAKQLPEKIALAEEIVKSFVSVGVQPTMNAFNNR